MKARVPAKQRKPDNDVANSEEVHIVESAPSTSTVEVVIGADEVNESKEVQPHLTREYKTPAQDKVKAEISSIRQDISYLSGKKDSGLATPEQKQTLKGLRIQLIEKEKELKRKVGDLKRHRQFREERRILIKEKPEVAAELRYRQVPGRPSLEVEQPELLKAIVDIALHGSSADERRRSDVIRSVKTLDELTTELQHRGFNVSIKNRINV